MLTELLTGGSSEAAVLRSADFSISRDGASGGMGGLAGAVASLAGCAERDPWKQSVWSIRTESGLAPFADRAEIDLGPGPDMPDAALEDRLRIELGYHDSGTSPVFTGSIFAVADLSSGRRRLSLTNASSTLLQRRVNVTFQQKSYADAAKQMASDADVKTGNLGIDETRPAFTADDRLSVYRHIARMAGQAGMIAWIDTDNKLQWGSPEPASPAVQFVYGRDVISVEKATGGTAIYRRWQGEGAAGGNGNDAWCWLLKKADSMAKGQEASIALVAYLGTSRSRKSVESAASGYTATHYCSQARFRIQVAGAADVTIGSTVSVTGTPEGKQDCTGIVIHVRHQLTKTEGFITRLEIVEGPASSRGGLL